MIERVLDEKVLAEARELIFGAQRVVITTHMSPDGDAMGSSLAMYHLFKALGKEVTVVVPNRFPAFFDWMDGAQSVLVYETDHRSAQKAIAEADLLVCLDFNSLRRIDGVKPLVEQAKARILHIDHHLYPDDFAHVLLSYPAMSSTCELVFRVFYQLDLLKKLNKSAAEALYTGMMTDTGNFSFSSNNPDLYVMISILLKKGVEKDTIYNRVFNTYSEKRMRMTGFCLYEKMKIYEAQKMAVIALSLNDLSRFDYQVGDTEGIVNMPLSIEGLTRSVLVREEKGKVKLSFRSQGNVPVNTMAAEHFSGGGHFNAAGGESSLSFEKTLEKLELIILSE